MVLGVSNNVQGPGRNSSVWATSLKSHTLYNIVIWYFTVPLVAVLIIENCVKHTKYEMTFMPTYSIFVHVKVILYILS